MRSHVDACNTHAMAESELVLRLAWQRHVTADTALLDRVIARHRERHRRYHTVTHVEWVVRNVEALAAGLDGSGDSPTDLDAVVAAAIYHDAVHEPRAPTNANERGSARLARRDLSSIGWADERCDRVATMIEGTATHTDPLDLDTAILFDADLSVLGADPGRYSDYARNVRAEYAFLTDDEWAAGRAEVLHAFLGRPSIFSTTIGVERWEEAARANMTAELAALA